MTNTPTQKGKTYNMGNDFRFSFSDLQGAWILEKFSYMAGGKEICEVIDYDKDLQVILDRINKYRQEKIKNILSFIGYSDIMVEKCMENEDISVKDELNKMLYDLI